VSDLGGQFVGEKQHGAAYTPSEAWDIGEDAGQIVISRKRKRKSRHLPGNVASMHLYIV
jgi:hypothetical protein